MSKTLLRITTLACFVLMSLLAYPAAKTAIAITFGEVSVNGNSVKHSMPVFEGDRLKTGADAGVMLHLRGATVQLSENSDIRYQGERLALLSGAAAVRGSEAVAVGPFVIAAVGEGYFRIERNGTSTKLSILSGKVKVIKGKNSLLLSGEGERRFSDGDLIGRAGRASISKEVASGAAGGAGGAAVTGWMKHGGNPPSISKKSPAEH